MKFIKQFTLILVISLIGEVLNYLLPLPVPASIYGLVLLFTALKLKVIPLEALRETSNFLLEIMPLMFIPPAVGLLDLWPMANWLPYVIITVLSTWIVMIAAGRVTQAVIRYGQRKGENK